MLWVRQDWQRCSHRSWGDCLRRLLSSLWCASPFAGWSFSCLMCIGLCQHGLYQSLAAYNWAYLWHSHNLYPLDLETRLFDPQHLKLPTLKTSNLSLQGTSSLFGYAPTKTSIFPWPPACCSVIACSRPTWTLSRTYLATSCLSSKADCCTSHA